MLRNTAHMYVNTAAILFATRNNILLALRK